MDVAFVDWLLRSRSMFELSAVDSRSLVSNLSVHNKKKWVQKQQEEFQHCFLTFFITHFLNVINTGQRYFGHRIRLIGTFKSEYEYKIKYEYDFQISKQSRPQNALTFPFLSIRKVGCALQNKIRVTSDFLHYANSVDLESRTRT